MPVLSASLVARFSSRGEAVNADKLLSAVRMACGGHVEQGTGANTRTPEIRSCPESPGLPVRGTPS